MILTSRKYMTGVGVAQAREDMLVFEGDEYKNLMTGKKSVRKPVACHDFSGTITVSFKRNTAKKHKEFYG